MDYGAELRGKKIIVFGASRGIGFNIAVYLAGRGGEVVISSGNKTNLHASFMLLKKQRPSAQHLSHIRVDFSCQDSLEADLNVFKEQGQPFDVIIFSSGVLGPSGDFAQVDFAEWTDTFNINLFGPIKLIQYFLKNGLIRKNGRVICLSGGISGPDPYFIAYSATKHALNGFAYSLAYQLFKKEIWVNSILPGNYNTGMNQERIELGPEKIGQENYKISLARLNEDDGPKYEKLYALIEFLCAPAADGIYGRLISAQYDDWQNHVKRLKDERDELYKIVRKKY
jgi:3-oxoacyl-[acyl-carrier protein] reductase